MLKLAQKVCLKFLSNLFLASDDIYIKGIENLANPVCNKSCWTYQFFMMCYQKRRNTRQICFHSLSQNWKFMTVYQTHAVVSAICGYKSCFQKQQILALKFLPSFPLRYNTVTYRTYQKKFLIFIYFYFTGKLQNYPLKLLLLEQLGVIFEKIPTKKYWYSKRKDNS